MRPQKAPAQNALKACSAVVVARRDGEMYVIVVVLVVVWSDELLKQPESAQLTDESIEIRRVRRASVPQSAREVTLHDFAPPTIVEGMDVDGEASGV
jgi:hypothetical protein